MDILEALNTRRSIQFFDAERQVSGEAIGEILEIANLSPSSFNLQPWEVVVVSDPGRKRELRECAFGQQKVEEASAVLIVIANPNAVEENVDRVLETSARLGYIREEDIGKQRGLPFKMYGGKESETRRIFAVKNASFFAMCVMIAARAYGLETHPMDGFREASVKESFHIPADRIIPVLIAVGYPRPGLELLPRAFRRELRDFVRFNDYTL